MAKNRVEGSFPPESTVSLPATATVETPPVERKKRSKMTPEEQAARKAALAMEGKDEKFVRLAKHRVVKAIKAIRQLQHLANRSQYEWTADQAAKIVKTLDSEVRSVESKFAGSKTNGVTFSL